MRPSRHPQLGRVLGEMLAAVQGYEDDPMNAHVGFTPDVSWELERIVKREGFANVQHFDAVLLARCSHRWLHCNAGGW